MLTDFSKQIRVVGAVRSGHFVFKMEEHASEKIEARIIDSYPHLLDEIAQEIARFFATFSVEVVAAPAAGAISLGNRVAYHLGPEVRSVFLERGESGRLGLGEGHEGIIRQGVNVLVTDDTTTRGSTVEEVIEVVEEEGGVVAGVGLIWNRANVRFEVPDFSCVGESLPDFPVELCPQCLTGEPIETNDKYGRRFVQQYGEDPENWPANVKVQHFAKIEAQLKALRDNLGRPRLKRQEIDNLKASLKACWAFARQINRRYFVDIVMLMYDGLRHTKVKDVGETHLEGLQLCLELLKSHPIPTLEEAKEADSILMEHGLETIAP